MPTLLTRKSSPPNAAAARSTAWRIEPTSAASSVTGNAALPSSPASFASLAASRPAIATRTPLATSERAMPAPRSP
jgi:hypothetical protein